MSVNISRAAYAGMFGPTTGDKVRLADTELFIEIERDFTAQLARIRGKLSEGPASAYEILMRVQGVGDRREVALRYALSQVLSRLQHLVAVGDARRIQKDDGTIEFALAG